jgi:ATP synthase protein I
MSEPTSGPGSRKGDLSSEELAEFKRRASELGTKLDSAQAEKQAEIEAQLDKAMRGRGMAYGLRMSSELVAAILVGGFIGYMLDQWLGTKPWLFLLFFVLGFSAGILNLMRAFKQMQAEIAQHTGGNIGHSVPDDDDD